MYLFSKFSTNLAYPATAKGIYCYDYFHLFSSYQVSTTKITKQTLNTEQSQKCKHGSIPSARITSARLLMMHVEDYLLKCSQRARLLEQYCCCVRTRQKRQSCRLQRVRRVFIGFKINDRTFCRALWWLVGPTTVSFCHLAKKGFKKVS